MTTPTAIQWPELTLKCGTKVTLRYSYASDYQLMRWGRSLADASAVELAAAMAGSFIEGKWRSHGFERSLDLADLMEPDDQHPMMDAVMQAIKNRYPELGVSAQPTPGMTEAPKTGSSNFGHSQFLPVASGSQTTDSGV